MKTILVPTDFSKCAATALEYAMGIALKTGADIRVLHVIFPNEGVENNVYNAFWTDEYLAERKKGLLNWVKRLQRPEAYRKINIVTETTLGFPVPAVCDWAEECNADLIVMGTTGATGLRGVLLGSIAAGVMTKTHRPVLAIPKKAALKIGKDAVFATDFRFKVDEHDKQLLKEILMMKKSKLRIVHIADKPGERVDKAREHALDEKLGDIPHDFHYIHDRDVAQAVSNFIEATDAGTLVAVAHEHSVLHKVFFDSITRRFAHRIHVPMLILHDAA